MTSEQNKVLEKIKANDQHPEGGEIKLITEGSFRGYFVRETPDLRELWYGNGQLRDRRSYKDGGPEGLWESWHVNGQLWKRGYYKDGEPDGKHYQWYPNGQLQSIRNWVSGDFEGLSEDWDEEGRLIERRHFKASEIQWRERLDPTSKRIRRITYKKGFSWGSSLIDHFTEPTAEETKKKITLTAKKKKSGLKR